MPHLVATERSGWPPRRWWHALTDLFGEAQVRLRYEIEPETPTATCHLQVRDNQNALCGYPWEHLVLVPGRPAWDELPQWMRCEECQDASHRQPGAALSAADPGIA